MLYQKPEKWERWKKAGLKLNRTCWSFIEAIWAQLLGNEGPWKWMNDKTLKTVIMTIWLNESTNSCLNNKLQHQFLKILSDRSNIVRARYRSRMKREIAVIADRKVNFTSQIFDSKSKILKKWVRYLCCPVANWNENSSAFSVVFSGFLDLSLPSFLYSIACLFRSPFLASLP